MVSKHIYVQLVLRIIAITITALVLVFFFFEDQYLLTLLMSVFLVLQTVFLIRYMNYTNRKIAYFFDAIRNEDFSLRFPEKIGVKSLEELNKSLNSHNEMMEEIHIKKQIQEQYFMEIIKQANIGILTYNAKGHILFANPKMEELLNHKPLNSIQQLAHVDEELYDLFSALVPFDNRLIQLTNEREKKQIAMKSTWVTLNTEKLLLVFAQDIHQQLEEKETDSWVRLTRVLIHEMMNTITPITSISGSILKYYTVDNELSSGAELSEEHIKSTIKGLEVIKEQGGNLMDFVQSYRSFLNLPKPDKTLVSAADLLEKVKVLMGQESDTGKITFEIDVKQKSLEFFIDEKQIVQILVNLCKNAFQSIEDQENGIIKITGASDKQGKKYIEVWDNGPGVPTELLDKIFVPFFTTKNNGTGIGLSLSKQIMHLHGGNLQVHSFPFKETTFTLWF